MPKKVGTVIVGGGIAGLGCARTLFEKGYTDFIVVTPELLGRIPHSVNGKVNYGTYYVRNDYHHVLPYVTKTRRINFLRDHFHITGHHWSKARLFSPRHLATWARFSLFAENAYRQYRLFQKDCVSVSQVNAIKNYPELERLFSESSDAFIRRIGLEPWRHWLINPIVRSTSFITVEEAPAFAIAGTLIPLFVPTYEFEFNLEQLIGSFRSNIHIGDAVTEIKRHQNQWIVVTKKGQVVGRNIVIATPMNVTKSLIPIAEPTNPAISVYMYHLKGVAKNEKSRGFLELTGGSQKTMVVTHELDGTHLFYSRTKKPEFSRYFKEWEIIAERHWSPAFFLGGNFVEADRGDNLYLAGDHNVSSMEDAYITGIYAANQILKKADK